jgi:Lar family restriction alleviation protein
MQEITLKPCPFCGGEAVMEEIEEKIFRTVRFSVGCSTEDEATCMGYQSLTSFARRKDAAEAWNTRALPAQGEPVAWVVYAPNGDVRLWSQSGDVATAYADARDLTCTPLYAALPSSPAPYPGSLNSGESDLHVTADSGAGEAIFAECAEIALEHHGLGKVRGYNAACRDIAEAIKTRASNRKTMDAVADAAQGEQK